MNLFVVGTAALLAVAVLAGEALAGDVTVHVHGVQARHGELLLALQSRDQFMQHAMTAGDYARDPKGGEQTFVLHNVPAGEYAISVLHDENGDHQMTFDSRGWPAEGWAISRFGGGHKPTFEEASVTVPASGATFDLEMRYPQ
jgi:uncharacterized protein (DUF2141 family)